MWAWLDKWLTLLEEALQGDYLPPPSPVVPVLPPTPTPTPPMPSETKAQKLYDLAKSLLDTHLSLDDTVPWGVGCAEAVSKVLVAFGIAGIPSKGIAGTAALEDFLAKSAQFQEIYTYTPGAVMVDATGTGNGKIRGHTGICGFNSIMSNNSETGKWDTQWDIARWVPYYETYGGFKTRYFLPV